MTLCALTRHADRHQGSSVTRSAHLLPSSLSSRQRAKHRALQATGLHVEIKEDFIGPILAFFSDIESFGLSQLQTVLGFLSQKDTTLLLDLAGGQFFITKPERYFLFQLVST